MKLQIVNPKSNIAVILSAAKNLKSQIENRKSQITFLTWLFVLLTSVFSAPTFADGSIIGWGEQVVGGDLSGGFVKVAAGGVHSLGLKQDGSIVAWGQNFYSQCNIPSPNSGFIAISAGWYHSLGLRQDGSIVAWGRNDYGQCNIPSPNTGFTAIAAGGLHSLGLKQDGSIVAWGNNDYGQRYVPSPNSGFIAISAGGYHSLGLKQDGSIVAWGANWYGQCNIPSPNSGFIAIAAGSNHSLGLKQDGSIVAWGWNADGQCNIPSPNSGFIAISAGGGYSLGLKQDGSIVACGWNGYGQCNIPSPNSGFIAISTCYGHSLGLKRDGSTVGWGWNVAGQCYIPSPNSGFIAIAVGGYYSLALKQDGSIVASGDNSSGQCNIPSPNSGFDAISAGSFHSLALKQDGSIIAWGSKYYGQCNIPEPNTGFMAMAAGIYHSLGLKNDGSIVGWGDNSWGQCNIPSPNSGFIAISAGGYYSLALKEDGFIVGWGDNRWGQCNIPSPNSGFIAVAAGRAHSLGLKQDGCIVAWGDNAYGQCNIPSPNSGFIAIAAGWEYSLALKQDGSIIAWGDNTYGKCNIPSPNSDFIAIAAGEVHSLAIKKVSQDKLTVDVNDDCRVDWEDVRIFTEQWLDSFGADVRGELRAHAAAQTFGTSGPVLPAEAGYPKAGGVFPNDEYFPLQWHLLNTGQSGGTPGVDIRAPEAWEITTGDPNIVIDVVDVGVDTHHPDLVNNLVPGYDFWDNDDMPDPVMNDPMDTHGTTCAGLIAAEGNNGIGVTGVAYNCKIMPIRHGSETRGSITGEEEVTAFRWAAANGADVISCSWGVVNPITHSGVKDVTKLGGIGREGKGCVVVFIARNQGSRIEPTASAAYPEVITVGATDHNDMRYEYSNYGPELDIVAPSGCFSNLAKCPECESLSCRADVPFWTTDMSGKEGHDIRNDDPCIVDYVQWECGTSMSGPVVAGVAALILSVEPNLTDDEVRHFLERSAKDLGAPGRDDYYGWGRVDARAALDMVLAKRADLNNDWKVDFGDFAVFAECWKTDDLRGDIGPVPRPDGTLDVRDLGLIGEYWLTEIPEIPDPNLLAHWRLDETEGTIAYDSAGSNHGTVNGGPNWRPSSGKVDGALELDGVNDAVRTPFVLNPAEEKFSVFAWVKGGAAGQVIISQVVGANWLLADPAEGKLMTELKSTGPLGRTLISDTVITDGDWHRVGLTWDGSNRILYVDDVEVAKDTQDGLAGLTNGLYIGTDKNHKAGTFWSGLIDDVRLYDRAVTP